MSFDKKNKKEKIKIHPIAWVLLVVIIGFIIGTIFLAKTTKERKFKNRYNESLYTLLTSKAKENQQRQAYFDQMVINDEKESMIKVVSIKKAQSLIDKGDLVVLCQGGLYSQELALTLGLFLQELKEHTLYKNKKLQKVYIIEQNTKDQYKDDLYKFYEKNNVDPYLYKDELKPTNPKITAFIADKNKKDASKPDVSLDINFKPLTYEYQDVVYASYKFLNDIEKILK